MSKKNKNAKTTTWVDIIASQRGDWGSVNPVTKVIPDKRRKPPKHRKRAEEADA